jgi:hypothetical protein
MKDLKFASEEFEADDITVEELEEQLSDELDMDDVELDEVKELDVEADEELDKEEVKASEEDKILAEAEALLKAFEADEEAPAEEVKVSEEDEILAECKEIEAKIAVAEGADLPDDKEIVSEEDKILAECKEIEAKIASEVADGVEDKIGDEAHGGDPSVSDIVDTKVDVSTDKEVFPTNSEYVARITKRLDRVANILEKRGLKRMAFRVDQLSDKLESSIRK